MIYRQNAQISTLSSGELDEYQYVSGDLRYRCVQKPKFEYSPFGQVFNRGLERDE